jgi:signal transduction histidine kinase
MNNDDLRQPDSGQGREPVGSQSASSAFAPSQSVPGRFTLAGQESHGIRYVNPPDAPAPAPTQSSEVRKAVAATLKEFAAHAAHEVSNPLNAIGINAELSLSLLKLGRIAEATEMMERLSRDCWLAGEEVRGFSRLGESLSQPVESTSLSGLLSDVIARVSTESRKPLEFFDLQVAAVMPEVQVERFGASYALRYLIRRLVNDALRRLCLQIRPLGAQHQLLSVHCDFIPALDPGATRPPLRLAFFQQLLQAHDLRLEWLKDGRTGFEISFPLA